MLSSGKAIGIFPIPNGPRWLSIPRRRRDGSVRLKTAACSADLLVKASGVGVFDRELEAAMAEIARRGRAGSIGTSMLPLRWTKSRPNSAHHLRKAIPRYDMVFTYGGGAPVVKAYRGVGARDCVPIYNALDPAHHFPAEPVTDFASDLGFLGNRLPDRETRVDAFFLDAARLCPASSFYSAGLDGKPRSFRANVKRIGHVGTNDHNAFFCSGLATLNVNRESMARYGFSPPTRVFEAVGAGACLITDRWKGIDLFLEPNREVLVAADGRGGCSPSRWTHPGTARGKSRAAPAGAFSRITPTRNARCKCTRCWRDRQPKPELPDELEHCHSRPLDHIVLG